MKILLLNGPNLNLLGTRAPDVYGAATLDDVEELCRVRAREYGHDLEAYQSNHEGALIDAIHAARHTADAIVFNPGAYTHTSYALRDALEAVALPTVEIHISNVREREPWRKISLTEPACVYQIFGRGVRGYLAAISHLHYRTVHPPITLGYGPHPDQVGDLRLPDGAGPYPIAVLFHGGGWAGPFTRDTMDGMAVSLGSRGVATWNLEYRRIPPVGGWRDTLADVMAGVDRLATLGGEYALDLDNVTVIGHTTGAQLGFFAAKQASLRPVRFVSLAGVLDLGKSGSPDRLSRFMGEELATHLDQVDPIRSLPSGIRMTVVHGAHDEEMIHRQGSQFVEAARASGDRARLVEVPGAGQDDLIDPLAPTWESVAAACLS